MSSTLGRSTPDFSHYELLLADALVAELVELIEFSISMGDEVFEDGEPEIEINTTCTVDGVLKTTTEPATTTVQNLNAAQNFPGFFTSSSAPLLGIFKILNEIIYLDASKTARGTVY